MHPDELDCPNQVDIPKKNVKTQLVSIDIGYTQSVYSVEEPRRSETFWPKRDTVPLYGRSCHDTNHSSTLAVELAIQPSHAPKSDEPVLSPCVVAVVCMNISWRFSFVGEPGEPVFVVRMGVSIIWGCFFSSVGGPFVPPDLLFVFFRRIDERVSFRRKSWIPTGEAHR